MTHPAKVLRAARKASGKASGRGYSSGTKKALVQSATRLFADHGYAGTSLDEVVAASRVTKGAFYHHFPSKLALFDAVFTELQESAIRRIRSAFETESDPWEQAQAGLRAYLDVSRETEFRRICMQEAPVALGHEAFTEAERAASLGFIQDVVDRLVDTIGAVEVDREALAAVFYGAIRSSAEFVADSSDPDQASARVEEAIIVILAGLRTLGQLVTE
ncbi:TetR/AcrR family transcriptional regulator [Aeromicrobium sp. Leaf350]|uniref:TetR/AcrR family transcriptional regulator n=1 Tax=Aeromicrobium sp. Leaf350 TaxID=2876565 RepID=UPI001E3D3A5A|nr:TetR/AcrR family transcriptional regulator [Aeromicrobium sp. Leaf350]